MFNIWLHMNNISSLKLLVNSCLQCCSMPIVTNEYLEAAYGDIDLGHIKLPNHYRHYNRACQHRSNDFQPHLSIVGSQRSELLFNTQFGIKQPICVCKCVHINSIPACVKGYGKQCSYHPSRASFSLTLFWRPLRGHVWGWPPSLHSVQCIVRPSANVGTAR